MTLESDLKAEIEKWSKRLDEILPLTTPVNEKGAKMIENIKSYRKDSEHFHKNGDLIKSFECLIWAWAVLEIGKEVEFLKVSKISG
jgi:hypothetical protein